MTSLRLEAIQRTAFDARLAHLGGGRLTRAAGITYLSTDSPIEAATYQLALAGVRIAPCVGVPAPATGLRPAIALDLVPLDRVSPVLDVVDARWVSLGEASAVLLRHRVPWSRGRAARDACRRLLRDEDAVLAWRRVLWCSIASMREIRSRLHFRPVVFDRAALDRHPLRWTYASDGAIERWAFA